MTSSPDTQHWMVAETLDPATPMTIVSVGGRPRDFTRRERVVHDALVKGGLVKGGLERPPTLDMKLFVGKAFDDARESRHTVERKIPDTPLTAICIPVPGPFGDAHAVQGWIGNLRDTEPPPPRPAAGVVWDFDKQMIIQPIESIRLSGVPDDEYVREVSLAEIIERGEKVAHVERLLEVTQNPPIPGDYMRFPVSVPHLKGHTMTWQVTLRSRDDEQCRGSWWMWEDMTSETNTPQYPTLEDVGYQAVHRRAGIHVAVVNLESATIPHWLTEPAPWIKFRYLNTPTEVFHPGDRARISAHVKNPRNELVVRTLLPELGYTHSRLILTPFPGLSENRQLMIAQVERDADPRERIPLEPGFKPGYMEQEKNFTQRVAEEEDSSTG